MKGEFFLGKSVVDKKIGIIGKFILVSILILLLTKPKPGYADLEKKTYFSTSTILFSFLF